MVSKQAPTPVKREGINPSGIIVMTLIFGLASAGLISYSEHGGLKPHMQVNTAPKSISAKSPAVPQRAVTEVPKPKQTIDTATPKPKQRPAEKPAATERPSRPESEVVMPRANVERRSAPVPPIAPPRPASVSIEKEAPPAPAPKLITAAELNAGKSATSVERVDVKSIGGKAIPWYSVRVGYTDSKARADILRDVLIQQGFIKAETNTAGDGNYYVSLGDYMFRYQAEDVAGQIKSRTSMEPQIFEKTVAK